MPLLSDVRVYLDAVDDLGQQLEAVVLVLHDAGVHGHHSSLHQAVDRHHHHQQHHSYINHNNNTE